MKLAALYSSGKDSTLALHKLHDQGHEIVCLITIKSSNPDSYMFHSAAIDVAKLQSEAMGIPQCIHTTAGVKEKELEDLIKAIRKAKDQFGFEGIITGALYSEYQATRIQKIADDLGLSCHNPLWHMGQEQEMRELVASGFTFIFTRVAAEGLDGTWLGKPIGVKQIDALIQLHKKNGLNLAGEGGEFESLVLGAPLFSKRIEIAKSTIVQHDSYVAELIIEEAGLTDSDS